jgi:hypothetical protein
MPDRLDELRRQRALVSEHLAWLDREIQASDSTAVKPASHSAAPMISPVVTPMAVPAQSSTTASRLRSPVVPAPDFPEYKADPIATESETRRGCLMAAGIGMLVIVAAVAAIYYFGYRDHPFFSSGR